MMAAGSSAVDRSLHEMLRDAPMMNDSNTAVHSGSSAPAYVTRIQRPTTLPMRASTSGGHYSLAPQRNGETVVQKSPPSKIETIKNWSISTYKCTRQLMFEKLGKSSRTVDTELETQIDHIKETQRKYMNVLRLTKTLANHFYYVVQAQHSLGEAFSDLAQKSPELQKEFIYNSETQKTLYKSGENLLNALNCFLANLNTLCTKTIEDTILTIKQYEIARVEYDAYRADLEALAQSSRTEANTAKIDEAQTSYQKYKEEFERLSSDVKVKLKFLNENRVNVMSKELTIFNRAVSAYFSGNQTELDEIMKQFCIKGGTPAVPHPSWLEQ